MTARSSHARASRGFALVVLWTMLVVAPADATNDTVVYRVKPKDTLELLAAEFYGDRKKMIFIMVTNKIVHPRALKRGERLRIPVSQQVITLPGDSWDVLAAAHLGSSARGPFLAEFNGLPYDDGLPGGTTVSIPFTVTHTANATESISNIAAAYFGDNKNAAMIRRYNFLDNNTIDKGAKLVIPVFNVRLSASKMPAIDAEAKARRDRQRLAQGRALKAIPIAKQAWREGDFAAVKAALAEVELDLEYLETPQLIDVGVLLGAMHVAHEDLKPAHEAFKRVLARKPAHTLLPYYHSPKVLAAWKDAGGSVEGAPGAP